MLVDLKNGIKMRLSNLKKNILNNRGKFIFYLLIVFIFVLTIVVLINFYDWKAPFVNPSDQYHERYIDLYYPTSSMIPIVEKLPNGEIINQPLFSVHILLRYTGELTEGKKVDVIAKGYAYPNGQKFLSSSLDSNRAITYHDQQGVAHQVDLKYIVLSGFEGTANYDETWAILPFSRGEFLVFTEDYNNASQHAIFRLKENDVKEPQQSMKWETQGDYSPFIIFVDANKTINTIRYPDYKIHVGGPEVEKQDRYARINLQLSLILLIFTIVTMIPILFWIYPDPFLRLLGRTEDINHGNSNTTHITPNNTQPNQSSSRKFLDNNSAKKR